MLPHEAGLGAGSASTKPAIPIFALPSNPTRTVVQRADDSQWEAKLERQAIPSVAYKFAQQNSVERGYYTPAEVAKPKAHDLAATHIGPDAGYKSFIETHAIAWKRDGAIASRSELVALVANAKKRNNTLLDDPSFQLMPQAKRASANNIDSHTAVTNSNARIDAAFAKLNTATEAADVIAAAQELHNEISFSPGNLPDYGPHTTINIPVSDRIHPNVDTATGRLSPKSFETLEFDFGAKVATTQHEHFVVPRRGDPVEMGRLSPTSMAMIDAIGTSATSVQSPYNVFGSDSSGAEES